jgi:hypothetical protein
VGTSSKGKKPKFNRGWFLQGHDPRRHPLTSEQRRLGGLNCAKKFTVLGRWYPDWVERCRRKVKNAKGDYVDGTQKT